MIERPAISSSDLAAMRAFADGTATEVQQKQAYAYIVIRICRANDASFGETDRETNFTEGRRHCGLLLKAVAEGRHKEVFQIEETKTDDRSSK